MTNEAVEKGYLVVKREGPIVTITVNRPEVSNAMNSMMWRGMAQLVDELGGDGEVKVIILRGAGDRVFIAGADIKEFVEIRGNSEKIRDYLAAVEAAMRRIEEVPKPVIAMVNGAAVGGGCELAVACDLRYAADHARFGIPAGKLGIVITFSDTKRLVRLVGPAFAKEILFTGRLFSAQEAYNMGLVNAVLPKDELEGYVYKLAAEIAQNAPLTIKGAKHHCLKALEEWPEEEAFRRSYEAFMSRDFSEGVDAYLEKRSPEFKGF